LTVQEQLELLRLARASVCARALGAEAAPPDAGSADAMCWGAFVTLRLRGTLRGCIGHIEGGEGLLQVVWRCAAAAASEDPRFVPVAPDEVDDLRIEISVLRPLEPVTRFEEIEVGRHGLVVQRGMRRGLLLPQVAEERGWTREEFLEHTCVKAGLHRSAWRLDVEVFKFEAFVFGEPDEAADAATS
jgi:AmmeMemoRadiSam system protein A